MAGKPGNSGLGSALVTASARMRLALSCGLTAAALAITSSTSPAASAFAYIVWLFVLDGAFVTLLVVAARRSAVMSFIARPKRIESFCFFFQKEVLF